MVNRIFPIGLTENLHLLKAEINGNFNKAAKFYPFSNKGSVAIVEVGGRAGGHSFGIIKRWCFHGSRRAENPNISAALRIRLWFADNKRGLWISSSPADASSFMPSRPAYDTVSEGGEKKEEPYKLIFSNTVMFEPG